MLSVGTSRLRCPSAPTTLTALVHRVVGRDVARGTVLLADEGQGLVVDLGIAVGEIGAGYAPLVKDLVMASGELVWSKVSITAQRDGTSSTDIHPPTVCSSPDTRSCILSRPLDYTGGVPTSRLDQGVRGAGP